MPKPTAEQIAAFERYQKAAKGAPINLNIAGAGRRELELGAKGDYAVYEDEPDRVTIAQSYPSGELFKSDMTEAELQIAISELEAAREAIIDFLNNPTISGFENTRQATLFDLEERSLELPEQVSNAVSTLAKYDFNGNITLFDVPEEIKEMIGHHRTVLENIQRNANKQ